MTLLLLLMMSSPVLGAVAHNDGVITMTVEDAQTLYAELARLQSENNLLKERLEIERQSVDAFFATTENERQAWQTLQDELNAEVKRQKTGKVKWGLVGIVGGALIMAVAD